MYLIGGFTNVAGTAVTGSIEVLVRGPGKEEDVYKYILFALYLCNLQKQIPKSFFFVYSINYNHRVLYRWC
jgi:hypothetical protein